MKHKAFFIFMTALLIGSPLYAQKYKIALIHSYEERLSGAGIVNKLFVKGLKDQQIDFQLRTFYLDCEKYESVEEERRISEFADSIRSWGGDLIAGSMIRQPTLSWLAETRMSGRFPSYSAE